MHTIHCVVQHIVVHHREQARVGKGLVFVCAVKVGRASRERPDQVSLSCCLIIDPSGIVFSIVSIMMRLVLLSTLASGHE